MLSIGRGASLEGREIGKGLLKGWEDCGLFERYIDGIAGPFLEFPLHLVTSFSCLEIFIFFCSITSFLSVP